MLIEIKEKLRGELKQHRINLTMIESGINQLINDPTTPSSLIHSLKLLRHSSMCSLADTAGGPQEKKIKLEGNVTSGQDGALDYIAGDVNTVMKFKMPFTL